MDLAARNIGSSGAGMNSAGDHAASAHYAVHRLRNKAGAAGGVSHLWHYQVSLTRQNRALVRTFPEKIYDGQEAALAMALAYRDAALRLLPPVTQRQRSSRVNACNSSGTAGVPRTVSRGTPYWIAQLKLEQKQRSRMFSVVRYGEQEARALALATRTQWLQEHEDRFLTFHPQATASAETVFAETCGLGSHQCQPCRRNMSNFWSRNSMPGSRPRGRCMSM